MRLFLLFLLSFFSSLACASGYLYHSIDGSCWPDKATACSHNGGSWGYDDPNNPYNTPENMGCYKSRGNPIDISGGPIDPPPPPGYVLDNMKCEWISPCKPREGRTFQQTLISAEDSINQCDGTCAFDLVDGRSVKVLMMDGSTKWKFEGTWRWRGDTCSNSPSPPAGGGGDDGTEQPPAGPPDCPPGTTFGNVNGKNGCFKGAPPPADGSGSGSGTGTGTGTGGETGGSGTDQTGDGTNNNDTGGGNGTADGSGDGTGNGDGEADGNGDGEDPKESDDFCKKNPSLSLCKEGKFSGGCGSGFNCTGDAVQCATAKYMAEQKCLMDPKNTDADVKGFNGKGNALVGEGEGKYAGEGGSLLGRLSEKSISFFTYSEENGACPPDQQFSVLGVTAGVPFSGLCRLAELLRPLVILAALISGFMILKSAI